MANPVRRDPACIAGITTADQIEPLLTLDGLARILSVGRSTIERMRSAGRLPKPDVYVGRRMPRWRPETVRRWIDAGGKAVRS